ncbi:MAG: hypothetical protein AAF483_24755 [Planctomycetota bacterium]
MAKKKPLLEQMRSNPQKDWQINDVEKLAKEVDLIFSPPSNGSHYKISSEHLDKIETIPAKRPIKPVYIRLLVGLCDEHVSRQKKQKTKLSEKTKVPKKQASRPEQDMRSTK